MPLSNAEVVPEGTDPGSEPGPPEGKNVVSIKLLISHCEGVVFYVYSKCAIVLFKGKRGGQTSVKPQLGASGKLSKQ